MEKHIAADNPAVAKLFAEWLIETITPGKPFHMALSGGSTPTLLFELIANSYMDKFPWEDLHLWWGDERCVPADHKDSNYGVTANLLLDHAPIPPLNVHRVRGENEPPLEADRYSMEINQFVPTENDWPRFDLVMLGMGSDGHTASIFPHEIELLHSDKVCEVATHPDSGQKRITLTGKVINNAQMVAFLVTGASKTEKVKAIFEQTNASEQYPARHIQPNGALHWFLDEAAAGV